MHRSIHEMAMKLAAAVLLFALTACGAVGQTSRATPSPGAPGQPSQSPASQNMPLFAIATGLPGLQLVNTYPLPEHATVKIVNANGRAYGEASFVPPPPPRIGNAVPLLQSPVRTAGGAVFYADSAGAVHILKTDGSTSVVATFPLTNAQQELSYAVSPDGAHLIAIILSAPPLHNPPPQKMGDPVLQEGAHWTLKLETADAGGSTTTTLQRDLGTAFPAPTQIVGWDKHGPLATTSTPLAVQQQLPSAHIFGALIHLAPDGTHLDSVGGAGCSVADVVSDGTVICDQDWQQFSVRTSSGATLWQATLPSNWYYNGLWLSPDANAVATQDIVATRTSVASAARQTTGSQPEKVAMGWLDSSTVIVSDPAGRLSLYAAHGYTKIRDLGLSGVFEGLL